MFKTMSKENESIGVKHIAVVGETGVGKSTLVNMLTGSNNAPENNNAVPCTGEPKDYSYSLGHAPGIKYVLWDTRGWNEGLGEERAKSPIARFLKSLRRVPEAERKLWQFLRSKDRRLSLILFCIEARKIEHAAEWKYYKKIFAKFCKKRVKVAVVVTQMDGTIENTGWKGTCLSQIEKAAGIKLDERLVEAGDNSRRKEILELIRNFS